MIGRVLVANRGEIARRVFRTCRDLGISTVAVYSDADAGLPFVAEADVAVRLPGSSPIETYLRGDLVVAAALAAGADAVHPGYGFLSENAGFARAVEDASLTWIGPPPDVIDSMGSKIEAKKLMADAGVPVLAELAPASITAADLPVLVKASAGGGGRGIRIVRTINELAEALASAAREAGSAFGDPTVFCEPLLEGARHIEVQVLADRHGTVWTLGERECSIQRRHQKIVEETPSPAVDDALRARFCAVAAAAAKAIGYVGAGTVEFLLARPSGGERNGPGAIAFLEVNTRLQVEHPVTECVYGMDLVAGQIAVAEGEALPPAPPQPSGHAIEVRLYAEDPAAGYRPQSGRLERFTVPGVDATFARPPTSGLRVDSGYETGSVVGVHYDPMLAKVVAYAPTRAAAARRLAAALAGARIHGVVTNRDLLVRILREPSFLAGATDTGYLDRLGLADLAAPLADEATVRLSARAAALADGARNRSVARVQPGLPAGWRNVRSASQAKSYDGPADRIDVTYDALPATGVRPDEVVLDVDGVACRFAVHATPDAVYVDSPGGSVRLVPVERFPEPVAAMAAGSLVAPMPGVVLRVAAAVGDEVAEGQPLLWLEAMKMEHTIIAPAAGVLAELPVTVGRQVEIGTVLAVVRALPQPDPDTATETDTQTEDVP